MPSSVKGKSLSTLPSESVGSAIDGGDQMNSGISVLPLSNANSLLRGLMSRQRSGQLLFLRMGNYP